MHRGSSNAGRGAPPPTETLPLSAPLLSLEVEVARAGKSHRHAIEVVRGSVVRDVVRRLGLAPEGTSVLIDGQPVPLDEPIDAVVTILLVPTFSGG